MAASDLRCLVPAWLSPQDVAHRFERTVNGSFYSQATESVLRLVLTVRRLKAENAERRERFREREKYGFRTSVSATDYEFFVL